MEDICCLTERLEENEDVTTGGEPFYRVVHIGLLNSLAFRSAKHCSLNSPVIGLPAGSMSACAIAAASGSTGSKIFWREISIGSTELLLLGFPVPLMSSGVFLPEFNLFFFFAGLNLRI